MNKQNINLSSLYSNFFQGIDINSLVNAATQANLKKHKITILDQGQFSIKQESYKDPTLQIKRIYQQAVIVQYEVIISKFKLQITLVNFNSQPVRFDKDFTICSSIVGTVKIKSSLNKTFVVKRQAFHKSSMITPIQLQWDMTANKQEINRVIYQYCFHKICSLYKIGRTVSTEIGFDLLCFKNHIEFHLQLCDKIYQLPSFRNGFNYEQFERHMKQNLMLLQKFKLIHKDIKPQNMLYSHQYKRYVLTDFGVSHSIKQNIGEKTKTLFGGNPFCMNEQIKNLYQTRKSSYVDLYENDIHGMRQSFKQILSYQKNQCQTKQNLIKDQQIQSVQVKKQIGQHPKQLLNQGDLSSPVSPQIMNLNSKQRQKKLNQSQNFAQKKERIKPLFNTIKNRHNASTYINEYLTKKFKSQSEVITFGYQFLKKQFVNIDYNSFQKTNKFWGHEQTLEIKKFLLQSQKQDLNKEKQDRGNKSFFYKQKLILSKIKQMIDKKEITLPKFKIGKETELKLMNYIRVYGYDIETINLCELLQKISINHKYQELLQKIKLSYKLKKIQQIYYTYDKGILIKLLRKKLAKLQIEKNRNQKQILQLCIQLLNYVEQYDKQQYIAVIEALSIEMNKEEDLIYKIEKLLKRNKNIINIVELLRLYRQQRINKENLTMQILFKKLYHYQQYEKAIKIGQQLLIMHKSKEIEDKIDQSEQQKQEKKSTRNRIHYQLAFLYIKLGKYEQALNYSQNFICQQPLYIASSYYVQSQMLMNKEKYSQALEYSKNSLLIKKSHYGQQHPYIASSHYQIAQIYRFLRQSKNSFSIYKKYKGQNHIDVAASHHQLSQIYLKMDEYQHALEEQTTCIQIRKKYKGQNHIDVAASHHQLSQIYLKMGNYQLSFFHQNTCIQIRKKQPGKQRDVAASHHQLSEIFLKMDEYKSALDHSFKSLQIKEKLGLKISSQQHHLALIYYKMEDYIQSLRYLLRPTLLIQIRRSNVQI